MRPSIPGASPTIGRESGVNECIEKLPDVDADVVGIGLPTLEDEDHLSASALPELSGKLLEGALPDLFVDLGRLAHDRTPTIRTQNVDQVPESGRETVRRLVQDDRSDLLAELLEAPSPGGRLRGEEPLENERSASRR